MKIIKLEKKGCLVSYPDDQICRESWEALSYAHQKTKTDNVDLLRTADKSNLRQYR